jgi:hypothetical protein
MRIDKDKNGIWKAGDVQRSGYGFQLTSGQLTTLQTTAVQLVPAPSIGGSYVLWPLVLYLEAVVTSGTKYTVNSSPTGQIEYTGKSTALILFPWTGLVDQNASTTMAAYPVVTLSSTTDSYIVAAANSTMINLGLEIKIATGTLTAGTGVVNGFLEYDMIAVF